MKLCALLMPAFMTIVSGLKNCDERFLRILNQLQDMDPYMNACDKSYGEEFDWEFCSTPECQKAMQTIYNIFPEDCEVPTWPVEDSRTGSLTVMTKTLLEERSREFCHWNLNTKAKAE